MNVYNVTRLLNLVCLKNNCSGLGASPYSFHKRLEQVNRAKKQIFKFSALCNRLHRGCNRLHITSAASEINFKTMYGRI